MSHRPPLPRAHIGNLPAEDWATLFLALQLGVGIYAAVELARAVLRRRFGAHLVGQLLMALLLIPLAVDGLFLYVDFHGQIGYALNLDPAWIRPGQLVLIGVGTVLWMRER